ncbi:MAG TPA: integrase, partial [Acetobacteraceae bacterium]
MTTGTALVTFDTTPAVPAPLLDLVEDARDFATCARAGNTVRAYRAAWADFTGWCAAQGIDPLPAHPGVVALYLTAQAKAGLKVSTLRLRLAGIAAAHRSAGHAFDLKHRQLDEVWAGIRRRLGTRQARKAAVLNDDLARMVNALPDTIIGRRDRALLLIGFGGALRRSELVALQVEDVQETEKGMKVLIRRSKTDQEGEGHELAIHRGRGKGTCPVAALDAWLKAAGIASGPIFR